jgi:hypothetical protein
MVAVAINPAATQMPNNFKGTFIIGGAPEAKVIAVDKQGSRRGTGGVVIAAPAVNFW